MPAALAYACYIVADGTATPAIVRVEPEGYGALASCGTRTIPDGPCIVVFIDLISDLDDSSARNWVQIDKISIGYGGWPLDKR